jgi:hypothetical protein
MTRQIVELRILPPFAISRLGFSPDPMDNFDLVIKDPIGMRQIEPADTLIVDRDTGKITLKRPPFEVRFRDADGNIRPIAPFFEVWARIAGSDDLVPLTAEILTSAGLTPEAVKWSVHVANIKAYRRTGDPNDRIEALSGTLSDHAQHALAGLCNNFLDGKSIQLGSVQYAKPSAEFPEIRLRFTPASGKVYGPPPEPGTTDPNIADAVYDPKKGKWKGYFDPSGQMTRRRSRFASAKPQTRWLFMPVQRRATIRSATAISTTSATGL